jgi:hypothetical protein
MYRTDSPKLLDMLTKLVSAFHNARPRISSQTIEWFHAHGHEHRDVAEAIKVLQASPVLAAIMACEPGSLPDVSYDDACQFRGRVKIVHETLARAEASERWRDLAMFRENIDRYWEVTEYLDVVEPVSSRLHMIA